MASDHESKLDKLSGKAQEGLDHFFDDPAKVEKARTKAEGFLGKHMDQGSADEVVNTLENVLRGFAEEDEPHRSR